MSKFFFDPEQKKETTLKPPFEVEPGSFFDVLQKAGVVKSADGDEKIGVESEGQMTRLETPYLIIEFGTYKEDYSIHVEPCHIKKNLASTYQVEEAVSRMMKLLAVAIPQTLQVDIYLPREDWKRKVISMVLRKAAAVWNFDQKSIEEKVLPEMFKQVQEVILNGKAVS